LKERIYILSRNDAHTLGAVRCMPGLQAAINNDEIWLRGIPVAVKPPLALLQLPVKHTYILGEDGLLFHPGGLTPVDTLKEMDWQPLLSFVKTVAPVAAMPGRVEAGVPVKLVPAAAAHEGDAMVMPLELWQQYAETAPAVRLQRLRFAVSENGEALIMGTPLPPLPGSEYWLRNGILLPCGYDFEIPLIASFLNKKYNAAGKAFILFTADNSLQVIDGNNFVQATRSAIRLTKVVT
jgi:MoxR-vWA-beta-propeller ternary system domain bpX2